jgi:hypothetical protein
VTKAEWLACADPKPMLEFLRDTGGASDRKLRLFAVACCRRVWDLLGDERSRVAVEAVEEHVDGLVPEGQMIAASVAASDAYHRAITPACQAANRPRTAACAAALAARRCSRVDDIDGNLASSSMAVEAVVRAGGPDADMYAEFARQAQLLRCLLGNPFRPVPLDPYWLPENVVTLARTMYDLRDFAAMPLLSDLLEESGCPAEVSEHCRAPGPHVRGCWVVDLILGRG